MTIRSLPTLAPITIFIAAAATAFAYPACPAGAARGGGGGGNAGGFTWNINAPLPVPGFRGPVTDTPFSEQHTQTNVTLAANGARLGGTPNVGPMRYRDSFGRTRLDAMTQTFGASSEPRITRLATIDDPVAGYEYVLDPIHQIAYRIPFCTPAAQQQRQAPAMAPPTNRPSGTSTDEDLGTKTMFGVTVTGQRSTTTWPPGSYRNNDITVTTSTETWTSKQYGEFVSTRTDPQQESTNGITTFSATEPDPSLFQIPAGYQVVDETAPFTVTVHYDSK